MTNESFLQLGMGAVALLKWLAPFDTGNLSRDAIRWEMIGNEFKIYVDEAIAPYMPYTNEEWLSPIWQGKKNPNEGWFERAAQIILKYIIQKTQGEQQQ